MTITFEIQNFKKIDRRKQKLLNCKHWRGQMKFLNNAGYQSTVGSKAKFSACIVLLLTQEPVPYLYTKLLLSALSTYDFEPWLLFSWTPKLIEMLGPASRALLTQRLEAVAVCISAASLWVTSLDVIFITFTQ